MMISASEVVEKIESLQTDIFSIQPLNYPDRVSFLELQRFIRKAVPGYVYLEVGSDIGGSLLPHLLDPCCKAAISIDPRPQSQPDERGAVFHYEGNSTARMLRHLSEHVNAEDLRKLTTIESDVSSVRQRDISARANLVLIDGEHTNVAMFSDFLGALPLIAEDAVISFHDADLTSDGIRNAQRFLEYSNIPHHYAILPDRVAAFGFGRLAESMKAALASSELDAETFYQKSRDLLQNSIADAVIERRMQSTPFTQARRRFLRFRGSTP